MATASSAAAGKIQVHGPYAEHAVKNVAFIAVFVAVLLGGSASAEARPYDLAFSTYFGGSGGEGIRDVEADDQGNVYVAGTTGSPDFPTTPGAYDTRFDTTRGAGR